MSKHTPGPWIWVGTNRLPKSKCYLYGKECALVGAALEGFTENTADAALIAAAPELLDALKTLLAFCEDLSKSNPGYMAKMVLQDYGQWNQAFIKAPAAIAKAEGTS